MGIFSFVVELIMGLVDDCGISNVGEDLMKWIRKLTWHGDDDRETLIQLEIEWALLPTVLYKGIDYAGEGND